MSTILLVDDDFAILEGLALLLEGEGYRVRKAADGYEALERLGDEVPDLVICDVMMPVLTGTMLLARMAADARTRDVPVILMSATPRALLRDVPTGVPVLAKPFLLDELLEMVRTALDGARRGGG